MPEPTKRIIVDGVEFSRLFLFPRILGAITASLQPGRWVLGLLVLIALIAAGRLWDGLTVPCVNPGGLTHGRWFAGSVQVDNYHMLVQDTARQFALPDGVTVEQAQQMRPSKFMRYVADSYRHRRGEIDAADDRARQALDEQYLRAVRRLNESRPRGAFEATLDHVTDSVGQTVDGVLALSARTALLGLTNLLVRTPVMLWQDHTWFLLLFGAFFLIVYALGGGAISRMAACQTALEERLTIREAVDFALGDWLRLISAVALPLLIALVIALAVVLMGILMGAPLLDIVGGLLYVFALMLGCLIAFLVVGYLAGFGMLVAAVAVEKCDGADAMQRSYAYVVTRPLHLLWYWTIALIGMALGFILVSVFAWLTLEVAAALFAVITNNPALAAAGGFEMFKLWQRPVEPIVGAWHSRWTGTLIQFWQGIVVALVGAYILVYHFSASTIVYLLMRKASDGQDIQEIWRPGLVPGTLAPEPAPATPSTLDTPKISAEP